MSKKRKLILWLIYDIVLIAASVATAAAGKQLSGRAPMAVLIYFFIMALVFYIVGVVDLHQPMTKLESTSDKKKKGKR